VSSRQSDRIRVRRNPKKGRYERERIESILDRREHDTIDGSGRGGRLPSMSLGRTAGNDMETTV
jgi:hypothetical protein